jgi:DNA-binding XRE family transcriptional regulator
MSKGRPKPKVSRDQKAAIKAIRAREMQEQPGPDELIDRGEIDELVPHAQYLELRALTSRMRRLREQQGLSLTDLSEKVGMTRAAISRLENGWNLNPTLETLFRYAEAIGADLHLTIDVSAEPATEPRQSGGKRKRMAKK